MQGVTECKRILEKTLLSREGNKRSGIKDAEDDWNCI